MTGKPAVFGLPFVKTWCQTTAQTSQMPRHWATGLGKKIQTKENQAMIKWDRKFLTGVATIDEQHRTFIENINRLEGMIRITNPTVAEARFIIELVDFLEFYVTDHFRHEEECMQRFNCPMHETNKQEHLKFLAFFRQVRDRWIAEGYSIEVLAELHRGTSDWIQRHILGVDLSLRQFAGKADGQ